MITLAEILKRWMEERHYFFKPIAVLDGVPIYEVESNTCTSFIMFDNELVKVSSSRINISNYDGSLESVTLTSPTKTLHSGVPNFFEELEKYLNRKAETSIDGTQLKLGELNSSDFKITIHNSFFDGAGKDHPAIQILDPDTKILVMNNTFKDYNVLIQMPPPVDPPPPLQFQNPPDYQALQKVWGADYSLSGGPDSLSILSGAFGMRGAPDKAT